MQRTLHLVTERHIHAVNTLFRIWMVLCLMLAAEVDCPAIFLGYSQSRQENARIVI